MYVQDAVGVILVYDLTQKDSIDGVEAWYNMVQEHLDLNKIVVAIVGNKCDMEDQIKISSRESKQLKESIKADLMMDVSAKDNININELLQ